MTGRERGASRGYDQRECSASITTFGGTGKQSGWVQPRYG